MITELWSMKEQMVYPERNTTRVRIGNVYVLATPKGEILATRVK